MTKIIGSAAQASSDSYPPTRWPEAVSVAEASRLLSVGRTKLYELINDGTLPTVKLGRRRLVRTAAVRDLLAALEHPGIRRGPV